MLYRSLKRRGGKIKKFFRMREECENRDPEKFEDEPKILSSSLMFHLVSLSF